MGCIESRKIKKLWIIGTDDSSIVKIVSHCEECRQELQKITIDWVAKYSIVKEFPSAKEIQEIDFMLKKLNLK